MHKNLLPVLNKPTLRGKTIFSLIILLGVVFVFISFEEANAQRRRSRGMSLFQGRKVPFQANKRYLSVGFSTKALNYFGDLAPKSHIASTDITFTRPGFGVSLVYKYGPRFFSRGHFLWGRVKGDDFSSTDPYGEKSKYRYARNLSFRNDIYEVGWVGMFTLFANYNTYRRRFAFNPYIFVGVTGFYHNPKGKVPETDRQGNTLPQAGEWVALQPLGTEGQNASEGDRESYYPENPYSLYQFSLPFGLGFKYRLSTNLDFEFEVGFRYLFFDYIDDVSKFYVDKGVFDDSEQGRLARVMSDRSMETTAVINGKERDLAPIREFTSEFTYTGKDGETYTTFAGYGHENTLSDPTQRGGANANDIILITTLRINYILGSGNLFKSRRSDSFR